MKTSRAPRIAAWGAALTTIVLALSACSAEDAPAPAPGSADEVVYDGVLNFYEPVEYGGWQVASSRLLSNSTVITNLVDRLVWQDPETGTLVPWVAEDWEISEDQLTYTFHLREGISHSDGTPVDAQNVKANLDQRALGDQALGIAPDSLFADYSTSEVIGEHTLVVTLTQPSAGFLQALSTYRGGLLAASYLEQDWNGQGQLENIVASGPFVVADGDGVTTVSLERRDDYDWAPESFEHQGPAYLAGVEFTTVPEASTRVGALQSGQAHVTRGILPFDEEIVIEQGGQVAAFPLQGEVGRLIISVAADAPTQDVNVRLALQAATDREAVVATALSPSYGVGESILAHGTPGFVTAVGHLDYDPSWAAELLDEAGWVPGSDGVRERDGERLQFTLYVAPYYQESQAVLEVIQSQWREVGVETEILRVSLSEYQALIGPDLVFQHGQLSRADQDVLRSAYHSVYGVNDLHANDSELDRLVEAQAFVLDEGARNAAVAEAQEYILENAFVIPLYDITQVFGLSADVHGFGTEATARAQLYDTWIP